MPLTDDEFAKIGKPEAYTDIIEELQNKEEKHPVLDYEFNLDDEEEQ